MKGEPKKFEKSRAKSQAKFPMRQLEIGETFIQYN
jgi:hypothetical protein